MVKKMRKVLVPSYLREFTCIGNECEDNCCCGGWGINVDRTTYERYKALSDPELRPTLDMVINKNEAGNNETYARLSLGETGKCCFLDENMMCKLQKKYGEAYLCNVCMTYPRHSEIVEGKLEKSLSLSCPEAARKALLNKDIMEFDEILEPEGTRYIIDRIVDSKKMEGKPGHYAWELREFAIDLLQNRAYTLTERLIILGLAMKKIQEADDNRIIETIPSIVDSFSELVKDESLKLSIGNLPDQPSFKIRLIKELTDERAALGIRNPRFLECANEMLKGLGYNEYDDSEMLAQNYVNVFKKYFEPFISKNEYMLEHFIVNKLFMEVFPINGNMPVFDVYYVLMVRYAMLKLILVGMSGYHKGLDETLVVKAVQSFSHVIDHSPIYIKKIYDLLKDNGMTTLSHISILIKN